MKQSPREITETLERNYLSRFAQLSENTKGRSIEEKECVVRTPYQKDRDRIIHCKYFRKLKGKSQVFIVQNDIFRTRLTHTLEVSQISRTIARALRLNEDLVETIALGHDLGHTCFGHNGEEVLNNITGFFSHNEQSLRVVDYLERDGKGLNLTYEVRDGILNHTGKNMPQTLEGQLVRIVDRITYLCHDIQDSINAGVLKNYHIPKDILEILGETHSQRVNIFVQDIIIETIKGLEEKNEAKIYQSEIIYEIMMSLRDFMFKKVYNGKMCLEEKEKASHIVDFLYNYYKNNPLTMPRIHQKTMEKEGLKRAVVDYIASCTDNEAIRLFQDIVIPISQHN